ncbi:hypothetical protein HK104_002815 [Borealophlyctis nickersoniae]|nr:hypothetical protein HK104_002815 [Borealophlyctis nickersoniae]
MSTQPPRTIHDLPNELLIAIIRTLPDQVTLSRAASTCKKWSGIAQPLLFTTPEFATAKTFDAFLNSVEASEKVGNMVQEVTLVSTPHHWEFMDDTKLERLCIACPNITLLDLEGCVQIHDKGVWFLAANLKRLTHLTLNRCSRITDEGMFPIYEFGANLRCLELSCLPQVFDSSLMAIAKVCTKLEHVNLSGTRVSEGTILLLMQKAPQLTHLDVSSCYNLVSLEKIMEEKPEKLVIVEYGLEEGEADWEDDDEYYESDEFQSDIDGYDDFLEFHEEGEFSDEEGFDDEELEEGS